MTPALLNRISTAPRPCSASANIAATDCGSATSTAIATALPPALTIAAAVARSEEHTSELQSLMRISYAVFCLKKKHPPTENNSDHSNNASPINQYSSNQHTNPM